MLRIGRLAAHLASVSLFVHAEGDDPPEGNTPEGDGSPENGEGNPPTSGGPPAEGEQQDPPQDQQGDAGASSSTQPAHDGANNEVATTDQPQGDVTSRRANENPNPPTTDEPQSIEELKLVSTKRSTRRILFDNEVHEYIQVELEFDRNLYTRVCDNSRAIYIANFKACALCEEGCFLRALMKDYWDWQNNETKGTGEICVCGVTLEEGKLMMKENRQRELEALRQVNPTWTQPTSTASYGNGMWQFLGLAVREASNK